MQTFTGRAFHPLDPRAEEIEPADIAHALGMICRYGGHARRFYSVAEHCVLMSHAVSPENALWALLHDATEAYVGDMIRPLKQYMQEYQDVEYGVQCAIVDRFGLTTSGTHRSNLYNIPAEVKQADTRILIDEREAVLGPAPKEWGSIAGLEPLGVEIVGWLPAYAEYRYLNRLRELWVG